MCDPSRLMLREHLLTFDLDAELELWFSGLGRVKFEFKGNTDVAYLNRLIASHVL